MGGNDRQGISRRGDSYRIRWRDHQGRRLSETHSRQEDAELALQRRLLEVEETRRGLRRLAPSSRTVGELCDYWLEHRAPRKRAQRADQSLIRAHLRPALGQIKLRDLQVADIDRLVTARQHLSAQTQRHILTLLGTMLKLAIDLGWLDRAPRIQKPRVRVLDKDYRYLRNDDEIKRFLRAALDEGAGVHALYATAVYTGLRAGELSGLQWSDVDFERRLITVQRSYSGPTKAGDVRHVPILDVLLPVLKQWRLRAGGAELVFPNHAGNMHHRVGRVFQKVLHRVLDRAAFPQGYIVFHSLRHTFASQWMAKGGDLFKLQKVLGHHSPQMTQRYAHLAPDAFTDDWGRFGQPVEGAGLVVELRATAAT